MASEPTPDEAAHALREVAERRRQAMDRDSYPKWVLGVFAALVIIVGVISDLNPELSTLMVYLLAAGGLLLAYLPRWKRFGAAMGYRRSPSSHPVGMPTRTRVLNLAVLLGMMVLAVAVSRMLRIWEVPYPTTIFSVLIVATMPMWLRLRNRLPREAKAADRG